MSTEIKCTCPSGDGSLRWPCPAHQPSLRTRAGAATAVQPVLANDLVFGYPREFFRATAAGDVVISEGVSTTDAARAFWEVAAQIRPRPDATGLKEPSGNSGQLQQPGAAAGLNEPFGDSEQFAQSDAGSCADSPCPAMSGDDFDIMVESEASEYGEMLEDGGPSNGWSFSCEALVDFSRAIINAWGMECRAHKTALAARQPVGEPLWCMHILGPDDVHAAPSKAHAEKAAAALNAFHAARAEQSEHDPKVEAVVAPWPHSVESHAESVADFIPGWLLPRWQVEAIQTNAAPPAQADRMAIKMLVAAGFVSEDKANESLRIAHGFGGDLGQPAPATVPLGLQDIIGSMLNYAGVADTCEVTQGHAPVAIRNWAEMLQQLAWPAAVPADTFQAGVSKWMGECFLPSLYSKMTERGDRLLEEVLELLQSHGYDQTRVATLVDYVYGRPVGEPAQEVGGVMVTLAGYCWVAGMDMHAEGARELERITQPKVMEKIRRKQEAKNALHFDTPLPGGAPAAAPVDETKRKDLIYRLYMARDMQRAGGWSYLFAEAADALEATHTQPAAAKDGDA
ncbi:UNVERIFIED_CONTAM: hypothetical protein EX528_18840 [Xanthomonas axonopodis]